MKKVQFNKRKFQLRDLGRVFVIFMIHILGFFLYLLIVLSFSFIYKNVFVITLSQLNLLLAYPLTIGIIINVALHIAYSELGNSWIRLMMWIHSGLIAILISIIIFMF